MLTYISQASSRQKTMMPSLTTVDDAGLMTRHLAGDDEAFDELFRRLNHRLCIFALKFLRNPDQADDVIQEAWEKVILLRRAPMTIENPTAYIFMMVRNLCLNTIKYHRRTSPFSMLEEDAQPPAINEEKTELEELVFAALQALPDEYREVLVLNVYSGYSLGEIATIMNKSPEAMWKRASRAREKLRAAVIALAEQHRLDLPAHEQCAA